MFKVKKRKLDTKSPNVRVNDMGEIYITVAIGNPAQPELVWEGEFVVDTGAVDTLVPRQHLESIGIAPEGRRAYGLAGGQGIVMDIAGARIEVLNEITWGTVAFGDEGSEPLLGVTVLESVGIVVDPHNEALSKLPASGMRGFHSRP